jgi:hypothetical protein
VLVPAIVCCRGFVEDGCILCQRVGSVAEQVFIYVLGRHRGSCESRPSEEVGGRNHFLTKIIGTSYHDMFT